MTLNILHLDDDLNVLSYYQKTCARGFEDMNVTIKSISSMRGLQEELKTGTSYDVFIIDLYLDGSAHTGLSAISKCRELNPEALIFASSSTHDPELIHSSLFLGSSDFMPKELDAGSVVRLIRNKLTNKKRTQNKFQSTSAAGDFAKRLAARIPSIIDSAVNCVHVFGETGTGKEVVADMFAANLPAGTPFIRVNCGAINPNLMVSEMFGHARGSFTGAHQEQKGLLEAASGGWIFLDEIATLNLDAQASLLRAIDTQSIRRIGSTRDISVEFRLISATNEPLERLVEAGRFRKDLWQRLRETEILIPPLRIRTHEIRELVSHFCSTMRGGPYKITPAVMNILETYDWSLGNIRELRNCLRSMTEKSLDANLTPNCIPQRIWNSILKPHHGHPTKSSVDTERSLASLTLNWSGKRPEFDELCAHLLVKVIKSETKDHGPMSIRALARACGLPKSTLLAKIETIVDNGFISRSELNSILKNRKSTAGKTSVDFS